MIKIYCDVCGDAMSEYAEVHLIKGDAIKSFMDGIPHMCDRCFSFKRTINAVKLVKREILTLRNMMPPDSDGGCDG